MKNRTISVKGSDIVILRKEREDYISLTDMVRGFEDGLVLIEKMVAQQEHHRVHRYLGAVTQPRF